MKVFNHSGHAGVRTIIIINVASGAALNFLDIIHKVSLPRRWKRILAGVGPKLCMHVLSVEVNIIMNNYASVAFLHAVLYIS